MIPILFSDSRGTFDISTEHGKAAAFGRPQATPTIMTDESNEVICVYRHPSEIEKNTQLIKSLRQKYPGQSLLKAVDLYQEELLLKARREKTDLLKSQQSKPITSTKPTVKSNWSKIDRMIAQLDAMVG